MDRENYSEKNPIQKIRAVSEDKESFRKFDFQLCCVSKNKKKKASDEETNIAARVLTYN